MWPDILPVCPYSANTINQQKWPSFHILYCDINLISTWPVRLCSACNLLRGMPQLYPACPQAAPSGVVLRLQLFLMSCLHYCTTSVVPGWNHAHLHLHHKAYLCCHNQTMGGYVCWKIVHALAQVTISHGIQIRASQPTTLHVHIPSPLLCIYHN